jgi:hypothetical protein
MGGARFGGAGFSGAGFGGARFVGGGHRFAHHGFGHRRFGFGFGGYWPYYASGYYGSCWRVRHVRTPYGWAWRRVYVCDYPNYY